MIYIYNALLCIAFITFSPLIAAAVLLNQKWREGLPERFGFISPAALKRIEGKKVIWFHAASAGEVQALAPVIKEFKLMKPGYEFVVTTTSVNGKKKIAKELESVLAFACLLPIDINFIIKGFIEKLNPEAIVIVETELWPNLLHYAGRRGAPVIMINGRISVKSFGLYHALRFFFGPLLNSFDVLIVQSEKMVKRLEKLGVRGKKMIIMNNTKYSFEVDPNGLQKIRIADKKGKKLIVAGSIREGEEEVVIDGFAGRAVKNAVLVIAPRHLKRVGYIGSLLSSRGLKYALWSDIKDYSLVPDYDAVIVNTIGELSYIYMIGDIAVIGGGFKNFGGHNPMEAAVAGLPIIMGPNMYNFEDTADRFLKDGGAYVVETAPELSARLDELIANDGVRSYNGEKNKQVIEHYRGSGATTAILINEILIDYEKGENKVES